MKSQDKFHSYENQVYSFRLSLFIYATVLYLTLLPFVLAYQIFHSSLCNFMSRGLPDSKD